MPRRKQNQSASAEPRNAAERGNASPFGPRLALIAAVVLGLAIRFACVGLAPQRAYLPDHISNMGWSNYAFEHGPWNIYDVPAGQPLVARVRDRQSGRIGEQIVRNAHACNYPPLSAYIFWFQGAVWRLIDARTQTLPPMPPEVAERYGYAPGHALRVIDTGASRFADALPGIVFDFFLAWGVMALVRVGSAQRDRWREAIAGAITLLAPPIFLDSAFWNQADAWIACLLVWTLVYLLRERSLLAGVIFGLALVTKPQAILFGPVLAYIFLSRGLSAGGGLRSALAIWKTGVAALLVALFVAAPFMLADARDANNEQGPWRWFKRSYVGTIGGEKYERITLSAFNFWWLNLLAQAPPEAPGGLQEVVDSNRTIAGLTKARIGQVLLAGAILVGSVLCGRRWRFGRGSWTAFTFLVFFAAFVFPTGVHERYIYYGIPILIALAVHRRAWIPALAVLLIVGTAELVAQQWASLGAVFRYPMVRVISGVFAALIVVTFVYACAILWPKAPTPETPA